MQPTKAADGTPNVHAKWTTRSKKNVAWTAMPNVSKVRLSDPAMKALAAQAKKDGISQVRALAVAIEQYAGITA